MTYFKDIQSSFFDNSNSLLILAQIRQESPSYSYSIRILVIIIIIFPVTKIQRNWLIQFSFSLRHLIRFLLRTCCQLFGSTLLDPLGTRTTFAFFPKASTLQKLYMRFRCASRFRFFSFRRIRLIALVFPYLLLVLRYSWPKIGQNWRIYLLVRISQNKLHFRSFRYISSRKYVTFFSYVTFWRYVIFSHSTFLRFSWRFSLLLYIERCLATFSIFYMHSIGFLISSVGTRSLKVF